MKHLLLALLLVIAAATPAYAGNSACQSTHNEYDYGKTPTGFRAVATDGCDTHSWTGSMGQGLGSGSVTFRVTDKYNPWEGDLPSMAGGAANYCRARAAHEANLYWLFALEKPVGTEVTVRYSCG